LATTGELITVGPIESMSKSKKNVVDPDDIISAYGADTARWFMLSDTPPERDIEWTERGVEGAYRFLQRLWRLVQDVAALPMAEAAETLAEDALALAIRKDAHKALDRVTHAIEDLRFNSAVAFIYALTNLLEVAARDYNTETNSDSVRSSLLESTDILVHIVAPMMPHIAQECWATLGHATLLAEEAWPEADSALLLDDTITIAVQVNGKRRDELTIARDAAKEDIEAAALKLDNVVRAIGGRRIKKVVVVPRRIVNVVA
ncbi:MAG: class I tRNA ligase family protein, partial [Methyloceanibacter sp.]